MTDGAGCYLGTCLTVNLAVAGKMTGIYITDHFFCESGRGKSILDANIGTLMNHVKSFVGAGLKDVFYAENLNAALAEQGGGGGER